jgi:hypothetical protein
VTSVGNYLTTMNAADLGLATLGGGGVGVNLFKGSGVLFHILKKDKHFNFMNKE